MERSNGTSACAQAILRIALPFAGAVLLASFARTAHSQPIPSDSTIRAILKARVDSGRAVGMVVGVLENGKRRFVSYGSAGPGRPPLNEHTIFEIGSISKTFTSLVLADFVTRGTLKLDQPVAELLPAGTVVPSRSGRAITLVDLATHRSGLPRNAGNLAPADPADPYADYDAARLYAFLSNYTLPRSPGDSAEYSNLGVGFLGVALTRKSGAPTWGALVAERVTGPLGMKESWADVPTTALRRLSVGYDSNMDSVSAWHFTAIAGAGAMRSTANDMLTYLAAELDTLHGPLARAVALGRTPRNEYNATTRIALGWLIRGSAEHPIWWHNGGTGGFRSYATFDPARNVAVVVLTNASVGADDIGAHLIDPAVPLHMPPVPPHRDVAEVSTATFDRLAGDYTLTPAVTLSVSRIGEALYVQLTGQQKLRLWPLSREHYFVKEVAAEVLFGLPAEGMARSATLRQNGIDQVAPRRP